MFSSYRSLLVYCSYFARIILIGNPMFWEILSSGTANLRLWIKGKCFNQSLQSYNMSKFIFYKAYFLNGLKTIEQKPWHCHDD